MPGSRPDRWYREPVFYFGMIALDRIALMCRTFLPDLHTGMILALVCRAHDDLQRVAYLVDGEQGHEDTGLGPLR